MELKVNVPLELMATLKDYQLLFVADTVPPDIIVQRGMQYILTVVYILILYIYTCIFVINYRTTNATTFRCPAGRYGTISN